MRYRYINQIDGSTGINYNLHLVKIALRKQTQFSRREAVFSEKLLFFFRRYYVIILAITNIIFQCRFPSFQCSHVFVLGKNEINILKNTVIVWHNVTLFRKPKLIRVSRSLFFLSFDENICCGYSLEASQ